MQVTAAIIFEKHPEKQLKKPQKWTLGNMGSKLLLYVLVIAGVVGCIQGKITCSFFFVNFAMFGKLLLVQYLTKPIESL